jgi:methylated-DNA-protein-cysteine methyltransferase-like protein
MPSPDKSLHALLRPLSVRGRAQKSPAPEDSSALQAIWHVVARIPRGQVSTYGDVARAAGLPGRARLAGRALKLMPEDMYLPWHRVVGAGGRSVFPRASRQFREQTKLLRSEGVEVTEGRVDRAALTDLGEF